MVLGILVHEARGIGEAEIESRVEYTNILIRVYDLNQRSKSPLTSIPTFLHQMYSSIVALV